MFAARFFLEYNDAESSLKYLDKYEKVEDEIQKHCLVSEDPDVVLCKAFSLAMSQEYSTMFQSPRVIIDLLSKSSK